MYWCGVVSQEVRERGNWRGIGLEWYLRRLGKR